MADSTSPIRPALIATGWAAMARKEGNGCLVWMVLIAGVLAWCKPRDKTPAPASDPPLIEQRSSVSVLTPSPIRAAPPRSPPRQVPTRTLYATANVNLREKPSTAARVLLVIPKRAAVAVATKNGDWWSATFSGERGWIHGAYLSETLPRLVEQSTRPQSPSHSAPRAFIENPQRGAGQPIRQPYVGICDCPYDFARDGRRCGGRSAYSRPGGRSPQCYY